MCVYEVYVSVLTDEDGVGGMQMIGSLACAVSKVYMGVCSVHMVGVCCMYV